MTLVANARMYAVSPVAEALWQELLGRVGDEAGVPLAYLPWPAPAPLDGLWSRPDLGAAFACGFPVATGVAPVDPLAAPVPEADWAGGRALYRTDLVVRTDDPAETLSDTFGRRIGWTVEHSQSGFNALRRHLLAFRGPDRPRLYAESLGDLLSPAGIVEALLSDRIDVGPLDSYWHLLLARHRPEVAARLRVVDATAPAPIPAVASSRALPPEERDRLRAALVATAARPWFASLGAGLVLTGFRPAAASDYAPLLHGARAAADAGYRVPE